MTRVFKQGSCGSAVSYFGKAAEEYIKLAGEDGPRVEECKQGKTRCLLKETALGELRSGEREFFWLISRANFSSARDFIREAQRLDKHPDWYAEIISRVDRAERHDQMVFGGLSFVFCALLFTTVFMGKRYQGN